jgi:hypothetical protein
MPIEFAAHFLAVALGYRLSASSYRQLANQALWLTANKGLVRDQRIREIQQDLPRRPKQSDEPELAKCPPK